MGRSCFHGAKFHKDGVPILVDAGFRKFAEVFVGWHKEGLMPAEGWPAGAGTAYKNAAPLFLDGTVAMHMSGSWMLGNYDKNITDLESCPFLVVQAVVEQCQEVLVWLPSSQPSIQKRQLRLLTSSHKPIMLHILLQTQAILQHTKGFKSEVSTIQVSPVVSAGLSTFAANGGKAAETTPQAYWFQGYNKNFHLWHRS